MHELWQDFQCSAHVVRNNNRVISLCFRLDTSTVPYHWFELNKLTLYGLNSTASAQKDFNKVLELRPDSKTAGGEVSRSKIYIYAKFYLKRISTLKRHQYLWCLPLTLQLEKSNRIEELLASLEAQFSSPDAPAPDDAIWSQNLQEIYDLAQDCAKVLVNALLWYFITLK